MELKFRDVVYSPIKTEGEGIKRLYQSQDIERQAVRINGIKAERVDYETTRIIKSKELVKGSVDRIAIYAKEYIPSHFENQNCIRYLLTVNGEQHEVVPVNSHRNGIKIIKASTYTSDDLYTLNLNESIKSVTLEIQITTEDSRETPYISNLKVVQGGSSF